MDTDSVFVASGVTIASMLNNTILGNGSDHEALIYGTVASAVTAAIILGNDPAADGGEIHIGEIGASREGQDLQVGEGREEPPRRSDRAAIQLQRAQGEPGKGGEGRLGQWAGGMELDGREPGP